MRRRGLTLVELLIVVGVLAVLASILFPTCRCGSREVARRTSCKSNLKQLAAAVAMYTGDYDGHYPPAGLECSDPGQPDGSPGCPDGALIRPGYGSEGPGSRYGYGETWQGGGLKQLSAYTKNERILWCPNMQVSMHPTPRDPKSYYAAFEWLERPERVRYPEAKVLLLEAYSFHDHEEKQPKRHDEPGNPKRWVNVAFVDGHVKYQELSAGCSGSPRVPCVGWVSCMGPGGNGNYLCSGYGKGAEARDFP